jgi:hypothetical protein
MRKSTEPTDSQGSLTLSIDGQAGHIDRLMVNEEEGDSQGDTPTTSHGGGGSTNNWQRARVSFRRV